MKCHSNLPFFVDLGYRRGRVYLHQNRLAAANRRLVEANIKRLTQNKTADPAHITENLTKIQSLENRK